MANPKEIKNARQILGRLKKEYPRVKPALEYSGPFELLISTILSAQCTDERVNLVTKDLFKKLRKPEDYLKIEIPELEKLIFSTGFYRQKAKSLRNCCAELLKLYKGEVPADFEKLTKLPGVGRKTASVVAGNAFNIPSIAVDTHVKRLSNLLGFINSNDPEKIEFRLKELFPKSDWTNISHWLATHGRKVCIARRPRCIECVVGDLCPGYNGDSSKVNSKK